MNKIKIRADEFLTLYEGVLFTDRMEDVYKAIEKVFNTNEVFTHQIPRYIDIFREEIKNKRPELIDVLNKIGKFAPRLDNEPDKVEEAKEHVKIYEIALGSDTIEIDEIHADINLFNRVVNNYIN